MADQLHVKTAGEGDVDVVLLHGLFGSGNNVGQLARGLRDDCRVHTIDLPDHGRSAWLPSASIQAYAHSVASWLDERKLSECFVVGHSLGGKVAMQLAVNRPDLIAGLVVLDISPVAYTVRRHDHIFEALRTATASRPQTRAEARDGGVGVPDRARRGVRAGARVRRTADGRRSARDARVVRGGRRRC